MKVELEEIRLALSPLTLKCNAGIIDKRDSSCWKHNIEVHRDFLTTVIDFFGGKETYIVQKDTGETYKITAKKLKRKPNLEKKNES